MRKRPYRPASLDYAVFGLAAFLALFLLYEVAKRRMSPAPPPAYSELPPALPLPPQADVPVPRAPRQEAAGRGLLPRHHVDRVERAKRRPGPAIPAPAR